MKPGSTEFQPLSMIPCFEAFITIYANLYRLRKISHDVLIKVRLVLYKSSNYLIAVPSLFFLPFSKHISHKILYLIMHVTGGGLARRPHLFFRTPAFRKIFSRLTTEPRGGSIAAILWRAIPELPITCGNGLINVKVCITSESSVVGQAIDDC